MAVPYWEVTALFIEEVVVSVYHLFPLLRPNAFPSVLAVLQNQESQQDVYHLKCLKTLVQLLSS